MGGKLTWKSQPVSLLGILARQGCCHLWNNKPITVGQLVREKIKHSVVCPVSHTKQTGYTCFFCAQTPTDIQSNSSFPFLHLSFLLILYGCIHFHFSLCVSAFLMFLSIRVRACVCLRAFWQPDTSLFRGQISRYCERTSGFFFVWVGEEGVLVGVGLVFGRAKNVWMCVFLSNSGRGNQTGPVWSFVFIDKCTGRGNRKAMEKFVFLWRSVFRSVYACMCAPNETGQTEELQN